MVKLSKLSKVFYVLSLFIIITGFGTFLVPVPGLFNAEAIGPFINNSLPSQQQAGDIVTTPIYDNIQWESPIVALPFPETSNMLIVEMDGRFFTLSSDENTTSRTTVLDIQEKTWYYDWGASGNKHGGIQNAVFHPQFGLGQGKDYMYVYYLYNDNDAANSAAPYYDRLSRFTWQNGVFDPNSELIMINQYDTSKGHDGSGLTFGDDGFLYVSVGDEGTQNAGATAHTQKIDDRFRSGVWRIDVDEQGGSISHPINRQPSSANVAAGKTGSYTQGYYIPNDNPWVSSDGSTLEEFYAIGLRQPFRMTFDALTGNFWIGDVGGGQKEEIDLLDAPGLNFEWNYKEGTADGFQPLPDPYIGTARQPIYDFDKTGSMAVIGGYVYRGNSIPQLYGKYIYGNNGTGKIFSLSHTAGNSNDGVEEIAATADPGSLFDGISSFGLDHNNEILVLKLGKGTPGSGKVYRLTESASVSGTSFPDKLSQIGAFSNLSNLTPEQGIIPYDVNSPLWSAGTDKKRWVAIPNDGNVDTASEKINYSENDSWEFPIGTVFIKHFGQPDGKKLETRFWIHGTDGVWFGTTYKWNAAGTDADLLLQGMEEQITIEGETFDYLYPSVSQCQTCHTPSSGDVLGFRTHQLNRDIFYPTTGIVGNQLETYAQLGFIPNVNTNNVLTSYALGDNTKPLEARARSYFDSNCSHCHQPGGNRAVFDTRYTTSLANQDLFSSNLIEDFAIAGAQIIVPQDIDKSILYQRINSTEGCCAMPPLAKGRIDKEGVQLVANWINSIGADCASSSINIIGNTLEGSTNFIDGHNPMILINEGDAYTNTSGTTEEICLTDFNFTAQRLGNPITPFVVKVNGDNNFTILSIGQSRTSTEYNVGNNSFSFSDHSDDVIMLQAGETIAIGFMDALPSSPDNKIQSVIPAVSAAGEDEVWQSYTAGSTTNPDLFPTLTVGKSPGLGTAGPATNLKRSYKFNIGIEVDGVTTPTMDCTAFSIPGIIEAEDFCDQYGVQAEPTSDVGGGENIGYIQAGDWMDYEIQVASAGTYKVNYRVAALHATGGVIELQINGNNMSSMTIPTTGGWQTYTTVSNEIILPQGEHTLRVYAKQAGWNLNWLEIIELIDLDEQCQCASGEYSLLVNGSFEETSNPAYSSTYDMIEALGSNNSGVKFLDKHTDTDFPGWFTTGGIALQQGGFSQGGTLEVGQSGFLGFEAPDGNVFAEMDGNHHNQIISVSPGQVLDWEVTHRGRPGTDEITISAGPIGNQTAITSVSSPNTEWITHTGQYTVPNGVTQIQFTVTPTAAANGDIDSSNLLDNVKVCPSSEVITPDDQVVLYSDCNFNGSSISLGVGDYPNISNLGFPNDDLSSIKIPENFGVILYQNYNFGGAYFALTADDNCFINSAVLNDGISSFKIVSLLDCSSLLNSGDIKFIGRRVVYPGYNPPPIFTLNQPWGGSGTEIEYIWESKTPTGNWIAIAGANSDTYNPTEINKSTCYRMGAKRPCSVSYIYSKEICILVIDDSSGRRLNDHDITQELIDRINEDNWYVKCECDPVLYLVTDGTTDYIALLPGGYSECQFSTQVYQTDGKLICNNGGIGPFCPGDFIDGMTVIDMEVACPFDEEPAEASVLDYDITFTLVDRVLNSNYYVTCDCDPYVQLVSNGSKTYITLVTGSNEDCEISPQIYELDGTLFCNNGSIGPFCAVDYIDSYTVLHEMSVCEDDFPDSPPTNTLKKDSSQDYTYDSRVVKINDYEHSAVQQEDGSIQVKMNLGIDIKQSSKIEISPNPANDLLNIDLSNFMNSSVNFEILSINGSKLVNGKWDNDHSEITQVDLDNLQNGIYIIYMKPENSIRVALKFVVAKQ